MRAPRGRSLAAAFLVGACALGLLAAVPSVVPKARRQSVYADKFPDGEGRHLAEHWCMICHSGTLVTQQAKDSTGWEKTLTQMEKWGVVLSPAERDTLRGYLIVRFGPRTKK